MGKITLNTAAHIRAADIQNGNGTFVVEPVLYAYAEWINVRFQQAVITAFTALVNNDVKKAKEININRCSCCP